MRKMPASKADQSNQPKEILGLRRITKKILLELCKKNKLYQTPKLNDVLYLHYQGFQSIEELEEYTELKCLWLECNAISEIRGLECQSKLKCLFLQSNLIKRIENLQYCKELDTLNLSQNHINRIENCGSDILPVLNTLNLSSNYIQDAESIQELQNCKTLSVLDLSNNRIDDILIVKVFAKMPELKVLVLNGNPVVSKIPQYRKTLILECKKLTYLDSRPVFPKDRACAEAWKRGGYAEERKEHEKWIRKERQKITDSVNATIRMRNKHLKAEEQIDLLPNSDSEDDGKHGVKPKRSMESYQDASEMDLWDEVAEADDYLQPTSSESNVSDTSSGIKSKDSNEWSSEHVKSSESDKSLHPTEANINAEKSSEDSLKAEVQDYCLNLIDDVVVDIDDDFQPTSSESTISDTSSGIKSNDSSTSCSSQQVSSSESNESLNHSNKLKEDSSLSKVKDEILEPIYNKRVQNDSFDKNSNDELNVNTDDSSLEADEDVVEKFIKNVPEILADTPADVETKNTSCEAVDTKLDNNEDHSSLEFDFTNDEEDYAIEVNTNNTDEICKKIVRANNDDIANGEIENAEKEGKVNEEFQRNFEELSASMDKYLSECYKDLNRNNLSAFDYVEGIIQTKDIDSETSSTSEDSEVESDGDQKPEQCVVSRWDLICKYIKQHRLEKELNLCSQPTENLSNEICNRERQVIPNILRTESRPLVIPKIFINDKPLEPEFCNNNFAIPFPPDVPENTLANNTISENSQEEFTGNHVANNSHELVKVNEYSVDTTNKGVELLTVSEKEKANAGNATEERQAINEGVDMHIEQLDDSEELPQIKEICSTDTKTTLEKLHPDINKCLEIVNDTDNEEMINYVTTKEHTEHDKSLEINVNTDNGEKLEETSLKSQSEVNASTKALMEGFNYIPLDVSDLLRRSELNLKQNSQNEQELNEILKQIEQENEEKYQLNEENALESVSVQKLCQELLMEIIESLDFPNMEITKTKNYQIDAKELNEVLDPQDSSNIEEISISSSTSLPALLKSYKQFLNNIESGNRVVLDYETHEQRRKIVKSSAAEKSACLEFLIKQANLSEFNQDSAASLNAQLCKFYSKRMENVRRMVDRVYAQKDKYDDTLELIDGKLMVVKKSGEIEDYPPCRAAQDNDLNEFDKILETDLKSCANSLIPVHRDSNIIDNQDVKVSLSIDWRLLSKSQNSWFSICKPQVSADSLKYLKTVICRSDRKDRSDNLSLCRLSGQPQLRSPTQPKTTQIFDNIDKEFFEKLNFDQIDVSGEEDDQIVQCSRSYEELKDILTLNEVKEHTTNCFTKEESELIEQIAKGAPTGTVLANKKEDFVPKNIPEEDVVLQKLLKKTKEKDNEKIEIPENPQDPMTDDNDGLTPRLTKVQAVKIYEYKASAPEADGECCNAVAINFDSDEAAQPELTGENIFTFVYQEEDNEDVDKNSTE